jgi:CRP/FNR family transcriptional activator FtrB
MRSEELTVIRQLPLFADMGEANFAAMLQAAYLQVFPPQVKLLSEGDAADFLHVVVDGCVELFAEANGRETTLALVRPVSTFILAAVLKDAVYLMSARTIEKSRVLMIPSRDIRDAFERDAAFARSLVSELASAFRAAIKEQKNQKLRTGVERLANFVLALHRDQGGNGSLTLPCDKKTLASLLGMAPENLSRAFGNLKPYGVDVVGAEIKLSKLRDLELLAKPTPLIDDRLK